MTMLMAAACAHCKKLATISTTSKDMGFSKKLPSMYPDLIESIFDVGLPNCPLKKCYICPCHMTPQIA